MRHALILAFIMSITAQDKKPPIPTADEIKKAEKSLQEVFSREYGAISRPDKRAAAKKFLDQAPGARDMAEKYVLLRDCVAFATASMDPFLALQAIDLVTKAFDVNAETLTAAMIEKSRKAVATPEEAALVAEACLSAWERSMAAGNFDGAARWAKDAGEIAKNSKDQAIVQCAREMGLEAVEAGRLKERGELAFPILDKNEKDPGANLDMGLYVAFVRNDRDKGFAMLAQGSDAALQELAKKEVAKPADPEARFDLGDAWISLSAKEKNPLLRTGYIQRGRFWQDAALKGAQGLERTKIAKRIAKNFMLVAASYGAEKKTVDVMKQLQDAYDKNPGSPVRADEHIAGDPAIGVAKTLTVEYMSAGRRQKETVNHYDVLLMPPIPPKGVALPGASRRFEIVAAWVGIGAKFVDVSDALRARVQDPTTSVHGVMGGIDPNPGIVKSFVVVYELHGRRFAKALKDNDPPTPLLPR